MPRLFVPFSVFLLTVLPLQAGEPGQLALGEVLFQDLCAVCHGENAKGVKGAGSDIRDSIVRQVRMATGGGYEDMPEIELTDDEMQAIVAYLNSL